MRFIIIFLASMCFFAFCSFLNGYTFDYIGNPVGLWFGIFFIVSLAFSLLDYLVGSS